MGSQNQRKMGNPSELAPCRSRTGRRLSAVSPEGRHQTLCLSTPPTKRGDHTIASAYGRFAYSHSSKLFPCLKHRFSN